MNRRTFLNTAPAAALLMAGGRAFAATGKVDIHAILDDPEAPVGGNPDGNVTIVAFLDYNCPYCRRTAPELRRFVTTDGKTKVIYKDWPILAVSSVFGARFALAANAQQKYEAAHDALMAMQGPAATKETMRDAIASAGIDMGRLDADLAARDKAIDALLRRNNAQAKALGLEGTPVYLIGPYLVAEALNYDGFAEVVARFRERIGK